MSIFTDLHQNAIIGVIEGFDRIIFKGHFTSMFPKGAFGRYLSRRGVLLKDAAEFFKSETARIIDHAKAFAQQAGRPYIYLRDAHTHASGESKEDFARRIADEDNIQEGLVCIFSVLENCRSFDVVGNRTTQRKEVVSRSRRCLHLYWYLIDPLFGWMHVRLQTWAPYSLQIYINGREQLCRQLTANGVAFERSDNKILNSEDFEVAATLSEKFSHTAWASHLRRKATLVNPLLQEINDTGFGDYYWVIDQAEFATDILFRSRDNLQQILDDLLTASMIGFDAQDVMHFLGRKPHHAFTGEIVIDHKKRYQGRRIKFRLKRNSLKIYDHLNVLRIETTLNNPAEFKVLRPNEGVPEGESVDRWRPMRKGVSNFWRYAQVAKAANLRLLDALANAPLKSDARDALSGICRSHEVAGRHVAAFNPLHPETLELFVAALSGEFFINGFRNHDLQRKLYAAPAKTQREADQRSQRVSRLIAKLRGHHLIAKVKNSRLYRVTARGVSILWAAIRTYRIDFPEYFNQAQTLAL